MAERFLDACGWELRGEAARLPGLLQGSRGKQLPLLWLLRLRALIVCANHSKRIQGREKQVTFATTGTEPELYVPTVLQTKRRPSIFLKVAGNGL